MTSRLALLATHFLLLFDVGNCFLKSFSSIRSSYFKDTSNLYQENPQVNNGISEKTSKRKRRKGRRSVDYPSFTYQYPEESQRNVAGVPKVTMCVKEGNSWTNSTLKGMKLFRESPNPDSIFKDFFYDFRKLEARKTRLINNRAYAKSEPFENDCQCPPTLDDLSPPLPLRKDTFWISTPARLTSFVVPYILFPYIVQFLYGFDTLTSNQLDEVTSKFFPGVSILYGTFVSLTLSIMYTRQQKIQDAVSVESSLLAVITRNLIRIFRDDRDSLIEAGQCVADQIRTLVKSSRGGELMLLMYNDPYSRMLEMVENQEQKLMREQGDLGGHGVVIGSCHDILKDLMKTRAIRLSDESNALPRTHFFLLMILTSLILVGFIINVLPTVDIETGLPSNESSVIFAVLCSIYVLFYNFANDLNDAFGGIYQIRRSACASHLLQARWLLVNHPKLRGEIDFDEVQEELDGNVLIRTPGLGDIYFVKDELFR